MPDRHRSGRGKRNSLAALAAIGFVLSACSEGAKARIATAERPSPECEVAGFPCTWNEVAPEVLGRTQALGDIAALLSRTTPDLDSISAFLRRQDDVVYVEVIGTGVRYRVEGGGPAWVYLPDELAHHRQPGLSDVPPPGAHGDSPDTSVIYRSGVRLHSTNDRGSGDGPGQASTEVRRPGSLSMLRTLGGWLGPAPLEAAAVLQGAQGVAAKTPGEPKKALILAPFEYEFPGTGAEMASLAREIRDYRERNGGSVTFHADLHRYRSNPPNEGRASADDGTLLPTSDVKLADFLDWEEKGYSLIVVASHGTVRRCRDAPVGSEPKCPMIWAGRAKLPDYGGYTGIELLTLTNLFVRHPGLSPNEADFCAEDKSNDTLKTTQSGKRCLLPAAHLTLLGLYTEFFEEQYPSGINNAFIFLAACHSGAHRTLLKVMAPEGNKNVSVFGFDTTVNSGDGFDVATRMIDLIKAGRHSHDIHKVLKALDRTKFLVGRALDFGDEEIPAVPAEVLASTPTATHARDVVELVHPGTGMELEEGAGVPVFGQPDDGQPDSIRIQMRVVGIGEDDDVDRIRVFLDVDGRESSIAHKLDKRIAAGIYAVRAERISIGMDRGSRERIDLTIRAQLPGGEESRWSYENIRIGSYFSYSSSGDIAVRAAGKFPGLLGVLRRATGDCHLYINVPGAVDADHSLSLVARLPDGLKKGRYRIAPSFTGNPDANVGDERARFGRLWISSGALELLEPGAFHAELNADKKYGTDDRPDAFVSRGGTIDIEEFDGTFITASFSIEMVQTSAEGDYVARMTPDAEALLLSGHPFYSAEAKRIGRQRVEEDRAGYARNPRRRSATITGEFSHVIRGSMSREGGLLPDLYACRSPE
jgi:hypothetical protein